MSVLTLHGLALLLLLIQAVALTSLSFHDSPTWDEVGHYPAGISHWKYGRFELYCGNPPLIRMLATVPALFIAPEPDWSAFDTTPGARPEFEVGKQFISTHGAHCFRYFSYSRLACIPVVLLGGLICYKWAKDLYGNVPGLIALTLWCFCPNVLAHGHLITPDCGASVFGLAAGYTFWRWLRQASWIGSVLAGATLGLAQLTKSTFLLLYPVWLALWLLRSKSHFAKSKQFLIMLLLSLYVLNLGYGFAGSFQRLDDFEFVSQSLAGTIDGSVGNRFENTWLGSLYCPLPKDYLVGIDIQKREFEKGMASYLCGMWRTKGWYHYYIYACLIKIPVGVWLIGIAAVGLTLRDLLMRWRRTSCRSAEWSAAIRSTRQSSTSNTVSPYDEIVLVAPALAVFAFVSSQTGFNHHLRYVLPAFPFVFIWISKVGTAWANGPRWLRWSLLATLLWVVFSSLSVYPHYLSYFNELVGGARQGHWHLNDSNVDWGQDLLRLRAWYDKNPHARPLNLAYASRLVDPSAAGIDWEAVPSGPIMNRVGTAQTKNWPWGDNPVDTLRILPNSVNDTSPSAGPFPGWYVVSVNEIHRLQGDLEYFLDFEPVDFVGFSSNVYNITFEDANRFREEHGLPLLEPN